MVLHGICEHEHFATDSDTRPHADLWLSMLSAVSEDTAELAHLFHHDNSWNANGQACDAFDDSFEDDVGFY